MSASFTVPLYIGKNQRAGLIVASTNSLLQIKRIVPGSPAWHNNIVRPGDWIVSLNDVVVKTIAEMKVHIKNASVSQTALMVEVMRIP